MLTKSDIKKVLDSKMKDMVESVINHELGFEENCMDYEDFAETLDRKKYSTIRIHVAQDSNLLISFDPVEYEFQVRITKASESISVDFAQRLMKVTQEVDLHNKEIKFYKEALDMASRKSK